MPGLVLLCSWCAEPVNNWQNNYDPEKVCLYGCRWGIHSACLNRFLLNVEQGLKELLENEEMCVCLAIQYLNTIDDGREQ